MVKLGWVETTIGALVNNKQISIQTGPFGTVLSASEYVDYGIPVISVREIRQGYIQLFDETPAVSDLTYRKMPQFALKPYDLVFARKGSVDRSALIPENTQKLFLGSDGIRLRFSDPILAQIVFHCVQSPQTRQFLTVSAYGTTMAGLNETIISSIPIYIPCDSKEQQRIAEALSDVDELIASLEKLIEKKKAIKQGAMQELLTGKRRLPGFTGEWEEVELGQILDYEQPSRYIVQSTEYVISGTPVLTAGKSFVLGYTNEETGLYDNIPTVLFDDFLTISRYVDFPFKVKSSAVKMLKQKRPDDDLRLIFELIQLIDFQVVDHQRHWISQYSKIHILLPNSREQKAISLFLSAMDFEICSLEKKLCVFRQVKQGMMQQLLTGKIRLLQSTIGG